VRFLGCPGQLEGCLCEFLVMPQECCHSAEDSARIRQFSWSL
jgi:L-iditol 2-dehydrogenase